MDGVNAEVTAPQQFHLLVQVLVDGASDNTRRDARAVARAVHNGRAQHNQIEPINGTQRLLRLVLEVRLLRPRLDSRILLGRFLSVRVHLSSAQLDELRNAELGRLGCNLDRQVQHLLLVHLSVCPYLVSAAQFTTQSKFEPSSSVYALAIPASLFRLHCLKSTRPSDSNASLWGEPRNAVGGNTLSATRMNEARSFWTRCVTTLRPMKPTPPSTSTLGFDIVIKFAPHQSNPH